MESHKESPRQDLDKKLSVVLLGTQMRVGGAQKLLFEHARWFLDNGHHVMVVFFYDRDGLHEKWQTNYGLKIHKLSAFNKESNPVRKLINFIAGIWNLWKIYRAQKPDAIITFTHDSNILGIPLAWLAGIPARIGTHLGEIQGMPAWRERLHTLLINSGIIQTLVASSTRTRQNAIDKGVNPEQINIIYNSISPFNLEDINRSAIRRGLGLNEKDIFLLTVGRLVYEKGHEFLIDAMAVVSQTRQNIFAGICGGGVLQEELAEQIATLRLEKKVKLLGQWEDIRELLAAADIFILPSRWEGLPMALLEAMMAELPVIATRVEGVEEVVEDGAHGLLTPLEDSDALAKAILQLSSDPKQIRVMGAAAKQRVIKTYAADQMCKNYMNIILERLN